MKHETPMEEKEKRRKRGVVYMCNHSNWKAKREVTVLDNIPRLCQETKIRDENLQISLEKFDTFILSLLIH